MIILRCIYTAVLYLLMPVLLLRLYWKSYTQPAYRQNIGQRFALSKLGKTKVDIWIHAVSLGEVVAATPLIDQLLNSGKQVLLTTTTPTGSQQALKQFGNKVLHHYLPYDYPWALRRFYRAMNPGMVVIMETELWPNLIAVAKQRRIPVVIVNGRISDKAFKQYQSFSWFFKPFLQKLSAVCVQSPLDADRYKALGAPEDKVLVLGNIKFDVVIPSTMLPIGQQIKAALGDNRVLFLVASTHDNEEVQILQQLPLLKAAIPELVLLIAPRHSDRFQAVRDLSQNLGFKTAQRSLPEGIDKQTDVLILDSLGELMGFYAIVDYAFVGGSLVPIGGHNVLEPLPCRFLFFAGLICKILSKFAVIY